MKKIISIILAAAMMLSLIPSVFATGEEEKTIEIVYNFEGKFLADGKYADLKFDNWEYAGIYDNRDTISTGSGGIRSNSSGNIRVKGNISTTDDYWIAFKLKIDNEADCSMKIKVAVADKYAYARIDAYIFKTDTVSAVENGINDKNRLSASGLTANGTAEELTFETGEQLSDGKMHFEPGEYYFVFRPVSTDEGKNISWVTLYTLTLNGTVVEPEETEAYVNAFTPSSTVENSTPANADVIPLAYATDGTDIKPTNINATGDENGTYIVTTDAEINGYTFRYWARGLESKDRKRIVSFANEFTYTPSNEKNYLIAVYDKAGTAAATEYYNANGQKLVNGDELPYMAGYGQATGWKEPVYGIKEAIYGEPIKYEITIGDAEAVEYAWGTPVVCPKQTAPAGQEFWGWKKTINDVDVGIVSTDPEYTFYAWETCTVTPVFGVGTPVFDGEKRRIILGTFTLGGKNAVMAEFFGFDNALERGITINGTDYAMTNKNADQFTIVDDDNEGNISGYAILANGVKYIYNLNK